MIYIVIYKTRDIEMLPFFAKAISGYNYIRLREDIYLVDSEDKADTIHKNLLRVIRPGEGVYVGHVSAPTVWNGFGENVNQWIFDKMAPKKDILQNTTPTASQATEQFNLPTNSVVGDLFLYACQVAKAKKKQTFPLEIVGMPIYLHGYVVALNSACSNHFRCLPSQNENVRVVRYNSNFFGEITPEGIIAKCQEHGRNTDFVNESIARINNYFK